MNLPVYIWPDVAAVYMLCAVPLGMLVAGLLATRLGKVGSSVLGLLLIVAAALAMNFVAGSPGALVQTVLAIVLGVAAALIFLGMRPRAPQPTSSPLLSGVVSLLALLVIPTVYSNARWRNDLVQLDDLLDQSRFGEAQRLARTLAVLAPDESFRDRSLRQVSEELDREVALLERHVASPLERDGTAAARLERARKLAMLGRTDDALAALSDVHGPDADNLRGTIYETLGDWERSLASRERARQGYAFTPNPGGMYDALRGIGYCQRKLGNYARAEGAYQELLTLAPTADTHFLLAQFYDGAQDAEKARNHARQALTLDPARFEVPGRALIGKLTAFHFGCLGVFSAENANKLPR